jgi:proline racemase
MQYEPQAMLESLCRIVRRGSLEEEEEEAEEAELEPMIRTLASSFAGSTYLVAPRDPLPVSHL